MIMYLLGFSSVLGNVVYNIFKGPLELVIGLLYGVLGGVVLWYIPNQNQVMQQMLFFSFTVLTNRNILLCT